MGIAKKIRLKYYNYKYKEVPEDITLEEIESCNNLDELNEIYKKRNVSFLHQDDLITVSKKLYKELAQKEIEDCPSSDYIKPLTIYYNNTKINLWGIIHERKSEMILLKEYKENQSKAFKEYSSKDALWLCEQYLEKTFDLPKKPREIDDHLMINMFNYKKTYQGEKSKIKDFYYSFLEGFKMTPNLYKMAYKEIKSKIKFRNIKILDPYNMLPYLFKDHELKYRADWSTLPNHLWHKLAIEDLIEKDCSDRTSETKRLMRGQFMAYFIKDTIDREPELNEINVVMGASHTKDVEFYMNNNPDKFEDLFLCDSTIEEAVFMANDKYYHEEDKKLPERSFTITYGGGNFAEFLGITSFVLSFGATFFASAALYNYLT
ncbi:hypothetical protein ACFL1H_04455 [Nanoarchaeota archaeon]